jgi:hypothetical protein
VSGSRSNPQSPTDHEWSVSALGTTADIEPIQHKNQTNITPTQDKTNANQQHLVHSAPKSMEADKFRACNDEMVLLPVPRRTRGTHLRARTTRRKRGCYFEFRAGDHVGSGQDRLAPSSTSLPRTCLGNEAQCGEVYGKSVRSGAAVVHRIFNLKVNPSCVFWSAPTLQRSSTSGTGRPTPSAIPIFGIQHNRRVRGRLCSSWMALHATWESTEPRRPIKNVSQEH